MPGARARSASGSGAAGSRLELRQKVEAPPGSSAFPGVWSVGKFIRNGSDLSVVSPWAPGWGLSESADLIIRAGCNLMCLLGC